MNKKQISLDWYIYGGLFLIAFAVIFSSTYNPLNFRRMHVDSSVYMTITQGITRGLLPYRDFVDNKGPLAYLLNAPGLFLGGFTGVWLTELVLMCVSVCFAYKTALFFAGKALAFLGTAFSFIALLAVFTVCAGTEEYSLPFLMVSFYIGTKYFLHDKRQAGFTSLVVLGGCFACAVLIRLNMFPLWAGFAGVICVDLALKRRFTALFKYIAGFCAGTLAVCIPVYWYLIHNGIFNEFVSQVIAGGAAKGFNVGSLKEILKNFFIIVSRNYSMFPLIFGIFWTITRRKHDDFTYYLAYLISCFLMILFLSFSRGDSHYNLVLIPFYVPVIVFTASAVYKAFSALKHPYLWLALFFCVVFSEGILKYADDGIEMFSDHSGKQLINAGKTIDAHTESGDRIISLGINGYIYPFTKRDAASKYIYQGSGLNHIRNSQKDFLSDVLRNKPAVIAIFTDEEQRADYLPAWYAPVYELIAREYRLLSDENGYCLYKRNVE